MSSWGFYFQFASYGHVEGWFMVHLETAEAIKVNLFKGKLVTFIGPVEPFMAKSRFLIHQKFILIA